jgi:iron complex transport system substrate-binding protein
VAIIFGKKTPKQVALLNLLYNNNKTQNTLGYSNYWETGITNPDEVLADLIAIFSPTLLPNHEFTFYKKLQ